jgi:uncharacterized membrane protein
MSEFIDSLINTGFAEELVVVIISMLPILELRGALPIAINVFQIPWYYAFPLALLGTMIPVPIILLFLESIIKILNKIPLGEKIVTWVLERTRRRSEVIQKYEKIGLTLFVAIPLPVTGAWTGSIAAVLLGLRFSHAFIAILCGSIIAGTIVTCLSLLGWIGAIIAGIVLSIFAVIGWWKS